MSAVLQKLVNQPYKHGFVTEIESDIAPKGLNEDIIRLISSKKEEPEWLLEFRLKAYEQWLKMEEPRWPNVKYPKIDFQSISYYAAPKQKKKLNSMDEVDPELLRTFEKLGVPMHERAALAGVAVDVIFDSVSVATTYKQKLAEVGIIFCSISEAVHEHPDLVKQYLGTVVPVGDNYYAALNSAVFTDGTFCFIPECVQFHMDLDTYIRMNKEE
jgi:Fe-S cluster assembly protein SufB